ncbi:hypothetical protein Aperf_G00000038646 [Anoplocephala perfoliata]
MPSEDTIKTEKISKIEAFVNEKLRTDLKSVLEAGDAVYGEISNYQELQNLLEKFSDMDINSEGNSNSKSMETMVDMGCNFYMKAEIPSIERLYVDVGLGFHVELTRAEALKFVHQRVEFLTEKAEFYRKKSFEIRAHIRICLESLRVLQNLDVETRPNHRDVLS